MTCPISKDLKNSSFVVRSAHVGIEVFAQLHLTHDPCLPPLLFCFKLYPKVGRTTLIYRVEIKWTRKGRDRPMHVQGLKGNNLGLKWAAYLHPCASVEGLLQYFGVCLFLALLANQHFKFVKLSWSHEEHRLYYCGLLTINRTTTVFLSQLEASLFTCVVALEFPRTTKTAAHLKSQLNFFCTSLKQQRIIHPQLECAITELLLTPSIIENVYPILLPPIASIST